MTKLNKKTSWERELAEKLADASASKVTELVEEIYELCDEVGDGANVDEISLSFRNGSVITYTRDGWVARKTERRVSGREVGQVNTAQEGCDGK